ncbi:hypothetical protein OGAPHI_002152 [Ogataea philodendri]|uniref:Uncharacterized protein n=1 Tax=Ogataea philodendri TaxID=1378263 RepID=A0A9P8PA46_9ASCO|nr:uncharacterized protein OGAPHI_002152 [Ogataea philodendri]KAH3668398.1 hypothetical protein OGAPHI_002152 [Ogataea philodendri]
MSTIISSIVSTYESRSIASMQPSLYDFKPNHVRMASMSGWTSSMYSPSLSGSEMVDVDASWKNLDTLPLSTEKVGGTSDTGRLAVLLKLDLLVDETEINGLSSVNEPERTVALCLATYSCSYWSTVAMSTARLSALSLRNRSLLILMNASPFRIMCLYSFTKTSLSGVMERMVRKKLRCFVSPSLLSESIASVRNQWLNLNTWNIG